MPKLFYVQASGIIIVGSAYTIWAAYERLLIRSPWVLVLYYLVFAYLFMLDSYYVDSFLLSLRSFLIPIILKSHMYEDKKDVAGGRHLHNLFRYLVCNLVI